ncbi:MAG: cyclic nucleotide-binding domain-containing protein [Polyangiales bacterium]
MTSESSASDGPSALPSSADPDRFERQSVLGEGGMGTVHLAFDRLMLREVALKTLRLDVRRPEDRERFILEAQLTGQLDHTNIVPVYDLKMSSEGALPTLVMKYVDGEAYSVLIERLHTSATASGLHEALQVFLKVCDAISFAHERGVIHCDLKPENVIVGAHGQVYLMDWGAALPRKQSGGTRADVGTPMGLGLEDSRLYGTPGYMAPEQLTGDRDAIDATTDVYGLGGILCVLITGKPPRHGVDDIVDWQAPPSVEERKGSLEVPPELCRIADRALSRAQEDRFQTVDELKSEMETFMAGGGWFATRRYVAGDVIIREGDSGSEAFIITSGLCDVFKRRADGASELIRSMGPGEVFGELSVLSGKPRSATVVAKTDVSLRLVSPEALDRELAQNPILASFMSALTHRFGDLVARLNASQR